MFIHISALRILSIHSDRPPLYPQHSTHTHLLCSPLHSCHWGEFLQGGRGAALEDTQASPSPSPQSPGLRTHPIEKSWGRRALPWGWARWGGTAGIPRIPPCRAATWLGWQQVCLPMQVCGGRGREEEEEPAYGTPWPGCGGWGALKHLGSGSPCPGPLKVGVRHCCALGQLGRPQGRWQASGTQDN